VGSHATQAAPSVPQVERDEVVHTAPAQQPVGQDPESQTHEPAEHTWPVPHADPAPHLHAPAAQLSAVPGTHATHAAPPVPHAPSDGVLHVSPEQQPGHVIEHPLQAPWLHVSVPAHVWQDEPPLPQALAALPVSQTAPLQQPVGQEVPSQTQVPPRQRWPMEQAAPVPQAQEPMDEHPSAEVGSQLVHALPAAAHAVTESGLQVAPSQHPLGHEASSHVHTDPVPQAWPVPQGAAVPHWQAPDDVHVSAPTPQSTHVEPAAPHVEADRVSHMAPVQQPLGHDVASQTH